MTYKIFRLHFTSPVHIGTSRAEYDKASDLMHSDTLYAAILQAWVSLGIDHPVLNCDPTSADMPDIGFALSSLFPFYWAHEDKLILPEKRDHGWVRKCVAHGQPVYFFPLPEGLKASLSSGLAYEKQKKLRGIRFLDATQFADLLTHGPGSKSSEAYSQLVSGYFLTENFHFHPEYLQHPSQKDKQATTYNQKPVDFYQKHIVPRNYVPREGEYAYRKGRWEHLSDTEIFYTERLSFDTHSGLFGVVGFEKEADFQRFSAALTFLQDEGLGSDRHTGNGNFIFSLDELPNGLAPLLDQDASSPYWVNLSLYCPKKDELTQAMKGVHVAYKLKKRGGWIGQEPFISLRKNSVYMFEEGSIFSSPTIMEGKAVNLAPHNLGLTHPVWRVGKSIFVPINMADADK